MSCIVNEFMSSFQFPGVFIGGMIGGYLGFNELKTPPQRALSSLISAIFSTVTIAALDAKGDLLSTYKNNSYLENVKLAGPITMMMGMTYSIGVNTILRRYVFSLRFDLPA